MEQKYIRNKNIITDMEHKAVFGDKNTSINQAKRESRKLQGSALGQGMLKVY